MINQTAKKILKALSFDGVEVEAFRHMADLKRLDPMKIFYKKIDEKIYNGSHAVPIRIFFPTEKSFRESEEKKHNIQDKKMLLFIHGGGWVTESIDNYERICARLANATGQYVVAVEYRLAPEDKFPAGLEDCYAVAKTLYSGDFMLNIKPENITLIGDSAGGNLCAALSLMARDCGEFMPKRQILIYPAVNNCYTKKSPYKSVKENGQDYLLTAVKMEDYLKLYESSTEDRQNPYFAPILEKDLSHMPETLILTAEFDPLRDEGEEYGKRLKEAGNYVEIHRVSDALHGYFALGIRFLHVQESFDIMNRFLSKGSE